MRKSNGFVFMETIVVVAVLSVTLMSLFSTFSFLLRKARERETYDTTAYIYKTFMVLNEMETQAIGSVNGLKNSVKRYISTSTNNCTCYEISNDVYSGTLCPNASEAEDYSDYLVSCDLTGDNTENSLSLMADVFHIEKIYWVIPQKIYKFSKKNLVYKNIDATSIDYLNSKNSTEDRLVIVKYKTKYNGLTNDYNKEDAIFFASMVVN